MYMKKCILPAFLLLTALSAAAQSFKIVTPPNVNFAPYESFVVMKGEIMTPKDERRVSEDTLLAQMKRAIVAELEAKGYKHLDDSVAARFRVDYVAGTFQVTQSGNVGPLGETPASTGAEVDQSRSWSRDMNEGILEITMNDTRTGKEFWKSSGTVMMQMSDNKTLDAAVYKALKKFPKRKR